MVSSPMARSTASTPYDVIYSTPTKSLFRNEENAHRGSSAAASAKERFSKRTRVGGTPFKPSSSENRSECGASEFANWKQVRLERDRSAELETQTEVNSQHASSVVSVSQMRGWLNDFGKQNKAHYNKMSSVGKVPEGVPLSKPTRPRNVSSSSSQQAAMVVVKNLTSTQDGTRGPAKTPVRFKPRFNKQDVEATDNGYASVQKLSAWLADDPTSTKKLTHVRKGINVISKSRMFEKDMAQVIIEENSIREGSVVDKKKAFQNEEDVQEEEKDWETRSISVTDQKKWLQGAFRKDESRAVDEQSEFSVTSVSDKKKWLQNVFAKAEANSPEEPHGDYQPEKLKPAQELTDSEQAGKEDRDEVEADNQEKLHESALEDGEDRRHVDTRSGAKLSNAKRAERMKKVQIQAKSRSPPPPSITTKTRRHSLETMKPAPKPLRLSLETTNPAPRGSPQKEPSEPTAAEKEEFGFHAARRFLVKNSARNGNAVSVLSKVQRRRQKFEKLEKERTRGSGPKGLLKPSWENGDPSEGTASTSYTKTYVQDIAPKRSFEDLP